MKLKILIVTNLYPPQVLGGYERSMADLATLLQARGHQVLVLTSNTPQFTQDRELSLGRFDVDRSLQLGGRWFTGRPSEWLPPDQIEAINRSNLEMLSKLLSGFRPDVCLAGNMDFIHTCVLEYLLSAKISIAHYVMNAMPGYQVEFAIRSPLYRFIVCSDWIKRSLQEKGYPADTAQIVYPGADVESFYQPTLPVRDRLRIAYASLIMAYKGADLLVEALYLLHSVGIEFSATLAGQTLDPSFLNSIQDFIRKHGLSDRITFTGMLSRQELIQLYRSHNVLVFPSRFDEPFGISQIEAMASGLTLVTSGTGGAREIVEHGFDGLIFESGNARHLADFLSLLPEHPEEWEALARHGQHKAITQFNHARAVEAIEAILFEMTALSSARP